MLKRICFILLSGFVSVVSGQQKQLAAILVKDSITGMQVVYRTGKTTAVYCVGSANKKPVSAVGPGTVFQAASLSKVVSAYIALKLYDRGLFALDTPLYHYFKYLRIKANPDAQRITARMVLTHTSGLPNWATNPFSKQWDTSKLTLLFKPGTAWSYSGEGFVYLQKVLEHLTGKSFQELAEQEVFKPLNMQHSSFVWSPRLELSMAYGHNDKGEQSSRAKFSNALAAATLISTGADYSIFLKALLAGNGLKPATHKMMFTKAVTPVWFGRPKNDAVSHLGWGLGVGIEENEIGKAIWHWGDNGDFKCFFIAYPATGESLVYMANDENGPKATREIVTLFMGKQTSWATKWLGY